MMNTIVTEGMISFKELEKKYFHMYVNLEEKSPGLSLNPMIRNWQKAGIKRYTGIKEPVTQA